MITFGNPNKKGRKWRGWGQQVPSKTLGLAGNLLDNVPQLIIQGLFIGENGITGIAIASIIASALSLLFGIMRRLILFLVLKFSPEHSNSSKRESTVSSIEAREMIAMM